MSDRFKVQRVQHVSIPRPGGSDEEARRFYGDVLGLQEIPVPASLVHLDLIWYRLGDDELHLFTSDERDIHAAQHFCVQVDVVDALRRHLKNNDVEVLEQLEIVNRPRFMCHDPFDNLIEVTTIRGSYL